mmetsp:Transcript_20441/g.51824  ORF Transcript_20441/g.51824 Transcript_20441/m.51824 type:complete len:269 (-) Transcript_20441:17-823(-)
MKPKVGPDWRRDARSDSKLAGFHEEQVRRARVHVDGLDEEHAVQLVAFGCAWPRQEEWLHGRLVRAEPGEAGALASCRVQFHDGAIGLGERIAKRKNELVAVHVEARIDAGELEAFCACPAKQNLAGGLPAVEVDGEALQLVVLRLDLVPFAVERDNTHAAIDEQLAAIVALEAVGEMPQRAGRPIPALEVADVLEVARGLVRDAVDLEANRHILVAEEAEEALVELVLEQTIEEHALVAVDSDNVVGGLREGVHVRGATLNGLLGAL